MAEPTAPQQVGASENGDLDDAPVGDLTRRATEQTSQLIRQELRLAQLEMQDKAKHAGIGAGMFGAAGGIALFGAGALVAAAIMGLATAVDAWLAGLIVAGVLFVVAGVLGLFGKQQVQQATPPTPERALDSTRQDIEEIKTRSNR